LRQLSLRKPRRRLIIDRGGRRPVVPKYTFRILSPGKVDEVAELEFPNDAAALRDARHAIGDVLRDMELNEIASSELIEVRNQEGELVGRVSTRSPEDSQ
jgi:hypothetical protein